MIPPSKLPTHVAIIMDGNGRWAKAQGLSRVEGHRQGVIQSEEIITHASRMGIPYLTLYAFSKENWERPQEEVTALMGLLRQFLLDKKQKMLDNGIRLNTIGNLSRLPLTVQETIAHVSKETSKGRGMVLTLALSYGARDEILRAVHGLLVETLPLGKIPEELMESTFRQYLDTKGIPDPDLIIRTSGEVRISNFLLWQGAYAEYFFEKCNWPDFSKKHFNKAIKEYQKRERRYGKISEQL